MSKILVVHGISNQYGGEEELHAAWFPAVCDGLRRAEWLDMPNPKDCFCPFYGDLFRRSDDLGFALPPSMSDLQPDELQLLECIWQSAAASENRVPGPQEFRDTLVYAPRIVERALTSLAKAGYLANLVPLQFLGDLRQVVLYLNRQEVRAEIMGRVAKWVGPETRIVIGHSLGSVIAYEVLAAKPDVSVDLLTVGSPLGIRNIVFEKLTPSPEGGRGMWPGRVHHWTNIAATGDIVAAEKELASLFGKRIEDFVIDSGWDAHSSTRYLNSRRAGTVIARALA
ncbi:MAG: hypothetical protein JO184_13665 [Gammaproteobacteria bacterium]|nr:hypothetical protein [Gammaproteobacteria bacterium]